jgi:hypothetical protein
MNEALVLCQPKTVIIEHRFSGVLNVLSGICRLDVKLENVVAMRVKYFNITLMPTDGLAEDGVILGLFSTQLASNLSCNNFLLDVATDTANGTALGSNMIAWTPRISGGSPYQSSTDYIVDESILQRFARPIHLSEFDWAVQTLNAGIPSPLAYPYSIHVVIEFRQACQCRQRIKDDYY